MKTYVYLIELKGEDGTHHTVRKVFTSASKADEFRSHIAYISTGDNLEKVTTTSIVKVEID